MAAKAASRTKKKASSTKPRSRVVKKNILRNTGASHAPGKCSTCGYHLVWLHGGDCPLCKVCARCGNRVRHCVCLEGE